MRDILGITKELTCICEKQRRGFGEESFIIYNIATFYDKALRSAKVILILVLSSSA